MTHHVVHVANLAAYTPTEVVELMSRIGARKGMMRPDKIFFSAVSSGCMTSFGSGASLIAMASPWLQQNAPGILTMLHALLFPTSTIMIFLTGCEFFTTSSMTTSIAVYHGRLSLRRMLLYWILCFLGNLAGALFIMAIIFGYGGVFDESPYREVVISHAQKKQVDVQFHQIFLRAIGGNWLVCLAAFLGVQAKDLTSKVVGMWWPIFAFVVLGLEHVVPNMFFIPMGLFLGTPGLTVQLYIWKGIIPATLGNVLGGAVFCGAFYYWLYVLNEPDICVDGTYYEYLEAGTLPHASQSTTGLVGDSGNESAGSSTQNGGNKTG
ncbi:hypothetical protein VTK26DRAFT_8387 [Humicola hyalothermophila]